MIQAQKGVMGWTLSPLERMTNYLGSTTWWGLDSKTTNAECGDYNKSEGVPLIKRRVWNRLLLSEESRQEFLYIKI